MDNTEKKNCRRCGVAVDDTLINCPLCGAHVNDETAPSKCAYPQIQDKSKKESFWKWSVFISLLAMGICIVVDLAVNKTLSWAIHVMFGIALPWLCVARPLLLKHNVRKILSWVFFGIIALLFYLNGWINLFKEPWAFWLGSPVTVLVWQTVLEILCFAHKKCRADYEMSLTKLAVLSLICIGISFAWLKTCTWGWYVCAGRGVIDVVALAVFANKSYLGELKRRLHV